MAVWSFETLALDLEPTERKRKKETERLLTCDWNIAHTIILKIVPWGPEITRNYCLSERSPGSRVPHNEGKSETFILIM